MRSKGIWKILASLLRVPRIKFEFSYSTTNCTGSPNVDFTSKAAWEIWNVWATFWVYFLCGSKTKPAIKIFFYFNDLLNF